MKERLSLFFSSSSLTSSEEWHAPFESEWRVPPRAPSPYRRYWPEKYIKKKDAHSTAQTGSRVVLTISLRDKYIPRLRVCLCVLFISQERRCKKETEEEEEGNFYRFHSKMVPGELLHVLLHHPQRRLLHKPINHDLKKKAHTQRFPHSHVC